MPELLPKELDTLKELFSNFCSALALSLSEQINQMVEWELIAFNEIPVQSLLNRTETVLSTTFSLSQPYSSEAILWFSERDATILSDLAAGHEGTEPSALDATQLEPISTTLRGVVRGFANAISNVQGEAIEVESCATLLGPLNLPPVFALSEGAVQAQFSINIPGLESLDATLLFTPDLARALLSIAVEVEEGASGEESELTTVGSEPAGGGETPGLDGLSLLPSFDPNQDEDLPKGISLLLDIPLEVTVELGRVRMLIRDVLELGAGSIVELDRVAGEPVDLLVNGKLIAKGEVVVIEDNFGIRVTEILSPAERVTSLGKAS